MVYYRTNKILLVKKLLGHKNINSTMKYTQLIDFKDSDYDMTAATTVEEAKKLGEKGFEKYKNSTESISTESPRGLSVSHSQLVLTVD